MRKHLWTCCLVLLPVVGLLAGCPAGSAAIPVTGLSVSPPAAVINTHTGPLSLQLTAAVTPPDATDQRVMWISTDTSKATVDAHGIVTAAPNQNATVIILAQSTSGPKIAACTITLN